ncbi:MAG: PAS domain-containing sensor histidine kinase [Chitinophagaceae bacterium]|nr:MAG: PAS domain-containing sensor histidine kinase [Chitinophagaceae bacterium]
MEQNKTYEDLSGELAAAQRELEQLTLRLAETTAQLEEASETIEAIRDGAIDALVIKSDDGPQLFTLKGSDQTYRIIIEQMTEGAVTINSDGLIVYCNSQFAAMVGIGMEQVTGQYFSHIVSQNDIVLFNRLFDEAWVTPVKGELNVKNARGETFPVLLSLNPLKLEEGPFLSLIMTDLTLQKETQQLLRSKNDQLEEAQEIARNLNQNLEATVMERTRALEISVLQKTLAEKELRRNQEQLTRILETMVEGVQIIDGKGELMYANPMAQRIMGITLNGSENPYHDPAYPRFKMDGTPLAPDEDPLNRVLRSGKPVFDFEIGVQPPGKHKFFLSISAAPLKDEQDQVIGSVGTFMDVTQRRKVIQQKDEFISVASHELKTPVTSLKASLQLLNEIKDNQAVSQEIVPKLITQANKSLNKLSVLIEDLLNVSKIRGGQLVLNKQHIAIYDLLAECCEEMHQEHRFNIRLSGPQQLFVDADPDKIEQVLVNFLNNAMKYAADSKEILIQVATAGESVKVSVTDNGMGIPADKIPHLFDRYYRVDNSGTQYSGLGLGLYICAEIIRKHDGDIGVESEPGKGSTFWFTLPLAG